MSKLCPRCDIEKEVTAFQKCASKRSGYQSHCGECRNKTAANRETTYCKVCDISMTQYNVKKHLHSKKHYYAKHGRPLIVEKRCPRCNTVKQLDKFHRATTKPTGRACWCGQCMNAVGRKRWARRKAEVTDARTQAVCTGAGLFNY